jgi:hypothetical protein
MLKDRDKLALVLESFVALELKKLARFASRRPVLHHLRTVKLLEVDFVLEARGGDVVGIDVLPTLTVSMNDVKGLKFLEELAEDKFKLGVILYLGNTVEPLGKNLWAVPVSALWA